MDDPLEGSMNEPAHVQFRPGHLARRIAARTPAGHSPGETARRDLERYYTVLERTLAGVALDERAWNLLRDALNGTWADSWWAAHELAAEVEDALGSGLGEKWGLSGPEQGALLAQIRGLSPAAVWAVIDAVERWWARQDEREGEA